MKKIILLLFILLPVFGFSQRVYDIGGSILTTGNSLSGSGILKVNGTITVTDSTFHSEFKNSHYTFEITKKVDDSYFRATDGLKDYIIKITEQKIGKYSGTIRVEGDNMIVVYMIK
jgi:hypothetical protein